MKTKIFTTILSGLFIGCSTVGTMSSKTPGLNPHSVLVDLYHGTIDPAAKSAIESAGCQIQKGDGPITEQALQSVGVLWIADNTSRDYQAFEIKAVQSFVKNGGTLVCAGQAWSWASYAKKDNRSYPLNQLGAALGFTITAQNIGAPVNLESSPYLSGVESVTRNGWWPSRVESQVVGVQPFIRDENLRIMALVIPSGKGRIFVFGCEGLVSDNPKIVQNILMTR